MSGDITRDIAGLSCGTLATLLSDEAPGCYPRGVTYVEADEERARWLAWLITEPSHHRTWQEAWHAWVSGPRYGAAVGTIPRSGCRDGLDR